MPMTFVKMQDKNKMLDMCSELAKKAAEAEQKTLPVQATPPMPMETTGLPFMTA